MNRANSEWAALLAEPEGPEGSLDDMKQMTLLLAAEPKSYAQALISAANWLASALVLRSRSECLEVVEALRPSFGACIDSLSVFPRGRTSMWTLDVLSFADVAETLGEKFDLGDVDIRARLKDCLRKDELPELRQATVVMMMLSRGWHEGMKVFRKKAVHTGPVALVQLLDMALASNKPDVAAAPFEQFIESFPSLLEGDMVEWRQLLLAARLMYCNLGKLPLAQVAEKLAERVRQL